MLVSKIKKRIFSEYQSRRNSRANKIKNPSNSFAPYLTMPRTQENLSNNDSSNQSTSGSNHPVKRNRVNRIDAPFYHNRETSSEGTKSTQNYVTLEYSSDNSSIIQTRPVKRRKMYVNTIVSISESSNSGAPRRIERASKRIRLFPTSDINLSSTLSLSSNHANENKDNALKSSFENEITSPHKKRRRRRSRRRSNNTIPNQLTAQTQSRLILSRHNWVITPSKNNTLRSNTRQMDESDISNSVQLRNTRPLASTNAASQNPLLNGERQNNRISGEMVQNITTSFPAHRQNVRFSVSNSPNFSDESSPNTHHGRRPNSDHYNNPRSVMIRQTTNTSLIASGIIPNANQRSNTRTFVNRQSINLSDSETQNGTIENRGSVIRTSRNPTPITTPRQNITFSEPTVASHEETRNDLSADSDSDNSSSSSINELKPVVLRGRRAIFSSDNNTSSDSDASSIVVNRVRRPVQMVISDSESEENTRKKEVNASEKVLEVIHSDTDSETTEKCSICFGRFEQQEVGTPKTCKHFFCFGCIKKWAENNNTCPVDRRTFDSIIVRSTVQGEVVREEAVPPPEIANQYSDNDSDNSWIDVDYTSDYNVDDDMDYDEEFDEDYNAPDYHFDDLMDDVVDYDVPEYDVDYDTPDIDVNYDVPEYDVDYDTDFEIENYGTPDNDMGYDTLDNDVGYDTPDNDVGSEAPDADEEYNPPDYDGPDEICVVCSTGDGKEMIMCDFCNNVFHLQCLDPPLQDIPVFFKCPECVIIADNEH